jgi:DNA-binding SARP family transcriptional activator/TolB-like protein
MVRLQLLGALGLTGDDGHEIRPVLAQPKRFALLSYLAIAEPRGFRRRDALLPLFWPETAGEPARASLRRALHFLRSHLGEGVIVTRGEEEVDVAAEQLGCDVRVFEAHLAAGREAEALALYHGDLLAGFFVSDAAPELDEWIDRARRRYREAAFAAAERLADRDAAAGRLSTARFWSERALDLQPLSETALLRMLRLLDRAGERVEALHRYENFARRLKAELGVEPGPELRGLLQTLRERRPTPAALPSTTPSSPPALRSEAIAATTAPPTPPTRGRRWWPAAAAVAAVAIGAWAIASRRPATIPVLAVGALSAEGGSDTAGVGATLPELIATGLGNLRDVQVISRARLYEVTGELGERSLTGAALLRAAKLAGADRLVEGEIYAQADGWRLDLRLVELGTGAVRRSWVMHAQDPFALADSATARLAAELRRPAPAAGVAELSPTSLVARRYFDDGLRAYYRGDYAAADALFGLAVNEDSSFALALYYAVRTRSALGTPGEDVRALARQALRAAERGNGRYERLVLHAYWALADQSPNAVAIADSLVAAFPLEPEGYFLAGEAHWLAADYPGELRLYRRLAELDSVAIAAGGPDCRACLALDGMFSAYSSMDSVEQEMALLRWQRRVQPASRSAWIAEIFLFAFRGRGDEALRVLLTRADTVGASPIEVANQAARLALLHADFGEANRNITVLVSLRGAQRHGGLWLEVLRDRMQGRQARALRSAQEYEGEAHHDPDIRALGTAPLLRAIVLSEGGGRGPLAAAALFDSLRRRWVMTDSSTGSTARQHTWMLTHEITALAAGGDTARLALLADTIEQVGRRSGYARDQRMHHYARGLLWDARGRRREAMEEYRRASTSPTFGYTRINYRLAQDLVELGRPAEALPLLRGALHGGLEASNLYITHTELHEVLGRAFEALGQRDSAAAEYRWVAAAWRDADPPFRERGRAAAAKARN